MTPPSQTPHQVDRSKFIPEVSSSLRLLASPCPFLTILAVTLERELYHSIRQDTPQSSAAHQLFPAAALRHTPTSFINNLPELPRKSDSNFIFAGSVLVSGREQRPLLPEPRVSIPEPSPEQPEHYFKDPVLVPSGLFWLSCDPVTVP
jgi:hypothetical protein